MRLIYTPRMGPDGQGCTLIMEQGDPGATIALTMGLNRSARQRLIELLQSDEPGLVARPDRVAKPENKPPRIHRSFDEIS